ncbi:MAG: glycosyltransferase family 39 protein [Pirellulales bacterium]|nr:glycosyltransferase family 39 protein [Pirellulales bacterium]
MGPLVVALVATLGVLLTLGDPGITCDEFYDVQAGKSLVRALQLQGLDFFRAAHVEQNYGWMTPHPPLGRWVLGWTHHLFDDVPDEPFAVAVIAGRFAPALAFGCLVFLAGWTSLQVTGELGGTVAAVAVALSPRAFADAHFATLDTITALTQFAAIVALAKAVEAGARPRNIVLAGFVWGLALATKFQGLLLGPIGIAWLVWRLRRRAWLPILIWGAVGGVTFFVLWPWLWYAPVERIFSYVSSSTQRQALHVYYLGQVWRDVDAPWHYPWLMFAVTLPVGFLLLGLAGLWGGGRRWWRDPLLSLVAAAFLFILGVFSVPGTPVYDGIRLFLVAVPLWSVAVGVGAQWLFEHSRFALWPVAVRGGALTLLLAAQAVGLAMYHPVQLSYYNALVDGLPGASRLGFETTYWGDSVTEEMLELAAAESAGTPIFYAPHLAPFQAASVEASSPGFVAAGGSLVGWDATRTPGPNASRYALVYRRQADLPAVEKLLRGARVRAETSCQGVWLTRLYELNPAPSNEIPAPPRP